MNFNDLIAVYRMTEISTETRIKLIKDLVYCINCHYAANVADRVGIELISLLEGEQRQELTSKFNQIIEYCSQYPDQMWAATIAGIILEKDFRDAATALRGNIIFK
jgi:hypothetical protein